MFKNFVRNLKLGVDKPPIVWYNNNSEREVIKMSKKKDKRERKMTPQQLQELLHMRSRGYVQKNGKAYNRKQKHKGKDNDQ